jgi:hypothetical protein
VRRGQAGRRGLQAGANRRRRCGNDPGNPPDDDVAYLQLRHRAQAAALGVEAIAA